MDALELQTQANKIWHLHQIKPSTSKTCSNYLECGIKDKWAHYQSDIKNWYQPSLIRMKEVNLNWLIYIDWYSCLFLDCHVLNEYYVCLCLWKMIIFIWILMNFLYVWNMFAPWKLLDKIVMIFWTFMKCGYNAKYVPFMQKLISLI